MNETFYTASMGDELFEGANSTLAFYELMALANNMYQESKDIMSFIKDCKTASKTLLNNEGWRFRNDN